MKRFLIICTALIIVAGSTNVFAQKQYSKDCINKAKDSAKKRAKELTKSKWGFDGTMTLEATLEEYNLKTGPCGDYRAHNEKAIGKSVSNATNTARNNTTRTLAREMYEDVKGIVTTEVINDENFDETKMASKYKGQLAACLIEDYIIYKKNSEGKYDIVAYYLIDKERFAALAKKVSSDYEDAAKQGKAIRDSINEEFKD